MTEIQRNGGGIRIRPGGRHDVGDEFVNRLVDFFLAFAFEQAAGNADRHRQQRNQRQQRGIGQRRRADGTAIAHKTSDRQRPKVREAFEPAEFAFRAGVNAGQNFNETFKRLFCHAVAPR